MTSITVDPGSGGQLISSLGPIINPTRTGTFSQTAIPTGAPPDSSTLVTETSSSSTAAASQQPTSPAPSATASPNASTNQGSSGLPMPQLLAATIVPIAFIIILIPILYILWIRHKTRVKRRNGDGKPSPETPAQETRLLRHSPQNSTFLPSPLQETERIKSGSLAVFELRRSLEDHGRADSIGVWHQQQRNTRHISPPPERGPSPTLPSPKVPAFNRPPSEAWPLPANGAKLPSPSGLYDPHLNAHKPLPTPAPAVTPSPPAPSRSLQPQNLGVVNSRDQNPDIMSYASSDVLVAPGASFRPPSSDYELTPSSGSFPENARSLPQQSQRTGPAAPAMRSRDSDLVSELSYHEYPERDGRRDTDAISVVSAMTNSRRRSERDPDAVSLVSVLSPEEPRIPMEHYPL
ncbi:hypothetical protein MMC10_004509 [Thelotrema lepadinum]|nr:hypothetical protein [Thelotrema lepadinum]